MIFQPIQEEGTPIQEEQLLFRKKSHVQEEQLIFSGLIFVRALKLIFSEKATKIDKIFTVHYLLNSVKSTVKISSIFVAFLENMNFKMPDSQTSLLFVPDNTLVLSPFFNVQSDNLATKNWKSPKFARISMYEIFKYSKRIFCLFVFYLFVF